VAKLAPLCSQLLSPPGGLSAGRVRASRFKGGMKGGAGNSVSRRNGNCDIRGGVALGNGVAGSVDEPDSRCDRAGAATSSAPASRDLVDDDAEHGE
jgi:hypothetical protein